VGTLWSGDGGDYVWLIICSGLLAFNCDDMPIVYLQCMKYVVVQGAAEITPTFRKITVGSPKQVVGFGPFR
jgi:hypothetical protein